MTSLSSHGQPTTTGDPVRPKPQPEDQFPNGRLDVSRPRPFYIYPHVSWSLDHVLKLNTSSFHTDASRRNVPRTTLGKCTVSCLKSTGVIVSLHHNHHADCFLSLYDPSQAQPRLYWLRMSSFRECRASTSSRASGGVYAARTAGKVCAPVTHAIGSSLRNWWKSTKYIQ